MDHLQTCQTKSTISQVLDWVGSLLGFVGHKVKIHKRTPVTEKNGVTFKSKTAQSYKNPKHRSQDNHLPPPHTLIMDFTLTHVRFGHSHLHPMGQRTHTRRSDGVPDSDGTLKKSVRLYEYFSLHAHREASDLTNELFLRVVCFTNLKGVVGLIMTKSSAMRI